MIGGPCDIRIIQNECTSKSAGTEADLRAPERLLEKITLVHDLGKSFDSLQASFLQFFAAFRQQFPGIGPNTLLSRGLKHPMGDPGITWGGLPPDC
ncbi:MAG TPA: hypothetical protein VM512_03360 [Burkholderiaceae bacterium]|nr:hypothetical protein [Burkholderiaceae bacterium]